MLTSLFCSLSQFDGISVSSSSHWKKSLNHFFFGYTLPHVELPWAGIKLVPPALEVWGLNHWATREVLGYVYSSSISQATSSLKHNQQFNHMTEN